MGRVPGPDQGLPDQGLPRPRPWSSPWSSRCWPPSSSPATPTAAFAAGTSLFNNPFHNNTVDGTGTVTVPSPTSGTNVACLTATANSTTPPLLSCAGNDRASRQRQAPAHRCHRKSGRRGLRPEQLPDLQRPRCHLQFLPVGRYGTGADGIGFVLAAVDPANPAPPTGDRPGAEPRLDTRPLGAAPGLTMPTSASASTWQATSAATRLQARVATLPSSSPPRRRGGRGSGSRLRPCRLLRAHHHLRRRRAKVGPPSDDACRFGRAGRGPCQPDHGVVHLHLARARRGRSGNLQGRRHAGRAGRPDPQRNAARRFRGALSVD